MYEAALQILNKRTLWKENVNKLIYFIIFIGLSCLKLIEEVVTFIDIILQEMGK